MSYRCRVWKITGDGETELPACPIEHKTVDAALNCRNLRKGPEACHRWEIRGGAFVVEKGEGSRGRTEGGKIQGGISWAYSQDYIHKTERVTIAVDDSPMIDMSRPIPYSRRLIRWNADFAAGMATMLGTVGKWPERTDEWISAVTDIIRAKPEEDKDLPPNVIKGPWQSR